MGADFLSLSNTSRLNQRFQIVYFKKHKGKAKEMCLIMRQFSIFIFKVSNHLNICAHEAEIVHL